MVGMGINEKTSQNMPALSTTVAISHMGGLCGVRMVECKRYDLNTHLPHPAIEFVLISSCGTNSAWAPGKVISPDYS